MAITKFSSYWKHQLSAAPDINFDCTVDDENRIVEVTANHFDSRLFLRMALEEFSQHGINLIYTAGFVHGAPNWEVIFSMGVQKFKVEIAGVITSSREEEYTLLLQPLTS